MARSRKKAYFGFGWLISVIFALIPFTNVVFGIITRIEKGKLLLAILNFIIAPLFFIVDLISIIFNKDLKYLI